jgi:hypothetical protein
MTTFQPEFTVAYLDEESIHMRADPDPVIQAAGLVLAVAAETLKNASSTTAYDYQRTAAAALHLASEYRRTRGAE